MKAPAGKRHRGIAVVLVLLAGLVFATAPAWGSGSGQGGGGKVTCRGPGSLTGGFALSNHREVTAKRSDCKTARRVVKSFPKKCADAYAAQGRCKIQASGRWRCRSRIVGALEDGAPSKEKCKRRRSKVRFEVTYSPPIGGPGFAPLRAKRSGPFNEAGSCIDTKPAGKVIPPPPLAEAPFEIHALRGVPEATGRAVQGSLLDHDVAKILNRGLGVQPRIYPGRLPILLTPRKFNPTGWTGLTVEICGDPTADAIVVRTDGAGGKLNSVVAHELFHAYSDSIDTTETWWEEASATWSQHKDGYPEETAFDINLQYPNKAIDSTEPGSYPYGMSRFVQFLDDKGFVGGPSGRWPLQRQVIFDYPQATQSLANELKSQGTSLGEQVAAFWGDRIREKPLHGPQLRPGGPNANEIEVTPGRTEIPVPAKPLHTNFLDFTLAGGVSRVEFEFDPPADGYFWGATEANKSQRFLKDDSISFCIGGGDTDDLEWPVRFPVTFTNGNLAGGQLLGNITVRAQKDPEQCKSPLLNRACRVLKDADVSQVLGDGIFPFSSEADTREMRLWFCFYEGSSGEAQLNLARFDEKAKKVRERVKEQIRQLDLRRIDVGDVAGIGTIPTESGNAALLVMAVGREISFLIVGPGNQQAAAKTISKRIAGQID